VPRFGTAINGIDGRAQEPVTHWAREYFLLDYIDMVTEPGPDAAIAHGSAATIEALRDKVRISVEAHRSNVLILAGHHDCAANPASKPTHVDQIHRALTVMRQWNFPATLVGLWVDEAQRIEVIAQ
jgi:putative intracellular protease/amidase